MEVETEDILTEPKPPHAAASSSLLRTLLSLLLFIAVDYFIFKNWAAVILLVSIIFIHESGHFIAMKIFGYKGINMTFIPFIGAYVSGEATHFSKSKKIIMLLAGPLPGIVIGMALLFLYRQHLDERYYYLAGIAFLVLNVFNLLPVSPLDGGQVIETLFFNVNQVVQLIFLFFSLLVLFYFLYRLQSWVLIIFAWLIITRIRSAYLVYKVRRELDKKGVDYFCSYEDLSDEQYSQIRDVLVIKSRWLSRKFSPGEHSIWEGDLVNYIERILQPSYNDHLTRGQQFIFTGLYLLGFILPVIQWMMLRDLF